MSLKSFCPDYPKCSGSTGRNPAFRPVAAGRDFEMQSGYLRAGEILAKRLARRDQDETGLIYPMFFCYRHAVEMSLKFLVWRYAGSAGIDLPEKKNHSLASLWN